MSKSGRYRLSQSSHVTSPCISSRTILENLRGVDLQDYVSKLTHLLLAMDSNETLQAHQQVSA